MDVKSAIAMFTRNAAYSTHDENQKGEIREGNFADLVVVDRNPLKISTRDIPRIRVLATIVGGRVVYASNRFKHDKIGSLRS